MNMWWTTVNLQNDDVMSGFASNSRCNADSLQILNGENDIGQFRGFRRTILMGQVGRVIRDLRVEDLGLARFSK